MLFSLLVLAGTANFTLVVAQTTFGPQQVIIESKVEGVRSVYAADLDNDGDLDVLSASSDDDKIAWYENDGSGGFGPQQVITTHADGAQSVFAADLDNDGDMDVLSVSWAHDPMGSKIAWYENDGSGNFGPQQVITVVINEAHSVFAADLDNDGDMDVLSASSAYDPREGKIAWYENDGSGNFGPQQVITLVTNEAHSVFAADLDNDGDMDVLSASLDYNTREGKIAWYKNDGSGNFGPQQVITLDADASRRSVYAADMDNDGDLDVLSASFDTNSAPQIVWFENDDGGGFWAKQVIDPQLQFAMLPLQVNAADLDNDGDMDVLATFVGGFGVPEQIAWYKNTGSGSFGAKQILVTIWIGFPFIYTADLNNDGNLDILWSSGGSRWDNIIAWFENDGDGDFEAEHTITFVSSYATVHTADIDNDGDQDVLSNIAWHQNDGSGHFGIPQIITTFAASISHVTDLDNDGDMDVLSKYSSLRPFYDNKITWNKNDGNGHFGPQQVITMDTMSPISIFAADLDNDGDMDVLSVSINHRHYYDYEIACYKNDGNGTFGAKQLITRDILGATSVFAADLDNDGDKDVLSASFNDNKIAWYENDGTGSFGAQQIITTHADGAQSVYAADLDNDGDMDVLSASSVYDPREGKIAWYKNDGTGSFGPQQIITLDDDRMYSVFAADLDNDGDMDVLSASYDDDKIAWYENDGSGGFGPQQVITTNADGAQSVHAADLDNDGDMDVLSASSGDVKIAWYENLWGLVGVEDFKKPDAWFTLFPNPSGAQTYIQMEPEALQGNTIGLRITDAQGRWVLGKAALNAGSFPLALPQVPDGIYFVTLISGKTSQTLKWAVVSN